MSPRTRKLCSRPDLDETASAVATLEAPVVPSYSEIIRKRIRADIASYRAIVARVVAGEQVPEPDIVAGYETLKRLGFNPGQLEVDVSAVREHKRNRDKWEAAVEAEPAERARSREINAEVDTLKKRIAELQLEGHRLSSTKSVGYLSRCNELVNGHYHVLAADLEQAVEQRAAALKVDTVTGGIK